MATLYKRGNVWYSKLKIHGKRVRKPLSTNRRIAEDRLADLIKSRRDPSPTNMPLDEFRIHYVAHRRARNIKPKTLEADEHALRCLEETTLRTLSDVTPKALGRVLTNWIENRLWKRGPKKGQPTIYSINRDIRHIKMAMNWAHREDYARKFDWRPVKQIKTPKGRMEYWPIEELRDLREKCDGIYLTMTYLGARAGLRPAETYWLEWSDIDFSIDKVHIREKPHWNPKDYERRSIPMPQDLRKYLSQLKRDGSRVLGNNPPSLPNLSVYFRHRVRRAGLKGSLYKLRHTYASHYVQNGGNIYQLMIWLGHSSIKTTMIYAHLAPIDRDKTLDKMPSI